MLTYDVQWVDITANLAIAQQPMYFHPRPLAHKHGNPAWTKATEVARFGKYWTPQTTLLSPEKPTEWAFCHSGDAVRIPMWAFKTESRGEASVWALGIKVGIDAITSLRQVTSEIPKQIVLVLSDRVTDLHPENSIRCYVGVAVRTLD